MTLKVLFIGGSGEISASCVSQALRLGHDVTVYNRGHRAQQLDSKQLYSKQLGPKQIVGDVADNTSYRQLGQQEFDVVCQFLAFKPEDVERDIRLFSGRCAQYIFVSSASCYQKPWPGGLITEDTPLANPFMAYSQNKAACERILLTTNHDLPTTVVRPSHTYHQKLPSTLIDGDHLLWRMRAGKQVVVHDDGESLWALTRSEDFAHAFVGLIGNSAALGEACQIANSQSHSWNTIIQTIGELAGSPALICHVRSETLVEYHPDWRGPLLGDKANSVLFDDTKIAQLTGGWHCKIDLKGGLAKTLNAVSQRMSAHYNPDAALDATIDRIVAEQT